MAFITIITIPGSNQVSCMKYYFKNKTGDKLEKRFIAPGEVAEVPDSELDDHLATGKVMLTSATYTPPKRGRPPKQTADEQKDFAAIYEGRR